MTAWAPLPPMPEDPLQCRWCARRRRVLVEGSPPHCDGGCAPNDQAPYLGHCDFCEREFRTGHKWQIVSCYECDRREDRQIRQAYAEPELTYEQRIALERAGVRRRGRNWT